MTDNLEADPIHRLVYSSPEIAAIFKGDMGRLYRDTMAAFARDAAAQCVVAMRKPVSEALELKAGRWMRAAEALGQPPMLEELTATAIAEAERVGFDPKTGLPRAS